MWNKEVLDLAREVERHINGGRTTEAMRAFRGLCVLLHINGSPSHSFVPVSVPNPSTNEYKLPTNCDD